MNNNTPKENCDNQVKVIQSLKRMVKKLNLQQKKLIEEIAEATKQLKQVLKEN